MGRYSSPRQCSYCSYTSIHSSTLARHMVTCAGRPSSTSRNEYSVPPAYAETAHNEIFESKYAQKRENDDILVEYSAPYRSSVANTSFHRPQLCVRNDAQFERPRMPRTITPPRYSPRNPFSSRSPKISPRNTSSSTLISTPPTTTTSIYTESREQSITPTCVQSKEIPRARNLDQHSPIETKVYEGDSSPALFKLCVSMMEQVQLLNQGQQELVEQLKQQAQEISSLRTQLQFQ